MRNELNVEYLKDKVLSYIPKSQAAAVTGKSLCSLTGLPLRTLKEIITDLRNDYPICSKETEGGGYWIAENDQEIAEFISMIKRRRDGYNRTISVMYEFLSGE